MPPIRAHDHARCVADALATAEAMCASTGRRLTTLRRRILALVWHSHLPVKAYDLLAVLGRERSRVAPPTVYRALEFLQEAGLVHRIASLNAFIGCSHPGEGHRGEFLICTECGAVSELSEGAIAALIARHAQARGFEVAHATIEVAGRCRECRLAGAKNTD
jgi:Fur family zinc uptake transcriptional regulator